MAILPRLSIATKLYAIFALLAIATVALAAVAVVNARHHSALTQEFEAAAQGANHIERLNGLIYAVDMESRGIYMSANADDAAAFVSGLLRFNERIGDVVTEWRWVVLPADTDQFEVFVERIKQFQDFQRELVRRTNEGGVAAAREWGDNEGNRVTRGVLNGDLEAFGQVYSHRAKHAYA